MRSRLSFLACVVLLAGLIAPAAHSAEPESYIVVLKQSTSDPEAVADDHSRRCEAQKRHVYKYALKGYSALIPKGRLSCVQSDSRVTYIERDQTASISAQTLPWGIDRIDADGSTTIADNGSGTVSGVPVFLIDTGIDRNHADLNVAAHYSGVSGPNADCHGHGTHVAGIVGARDNAQDVVGAAPGVALVGLKALACSGSGTSSTVIKGVDAVTSYAPRPAVVNLSLVITGVSQALDDAIRRSADAGFFYTIAAGNFGADACDYSPARAGTHEGVMTVAATDGADQEWSLSNYGPCVDIWAPGVSILSTRLGGGTATSSGTSMAAPHVAGTAALYLSSNPSASPASVEAALKSKQVPTGTNSKDGRPINLVYEGDF